MEPGTHFAKLKVTALVEEQALGKPGFLIQVQFWEMVAPDEDIKNRQQTPNLNFVKVKIFLFQDLTTFV